MGVNCLNGLPKRQLSKARTNNITSVNTCEKKKDDKTLKATESLLGQQMSQPPKNQILTSYFRDNSVISSFEHESHEESMTSMLNYELCFVKKKRKERLFVLKFLRDLSSNRREPGWFQSSLAKRNAEYERKPDNEK